MFAIGVLFLMNYLANIQQDCRKTKKMHVFFIFTKKGRFFKRPIITCVVVGHTYLFITNLV